MTAPKIDHVEAVKGACAALAAAISLLERTPKAKKAAPSDTMFDMMLDDYRSALDTARAAIAALSEAPREAEGRRFFNEYDNFLGDDIGDNGGGYTTREGKKGRILQQVGTKVVHVYGAHRLVEVIPARTLTKEPADV